MRRRLSGPNARQISLSASRGASRGPESAHGAGARYVRANAPMSQATLHAARIVRPLHRVNDRVETRSHQVTQMPAPAIFALHIHSDSQVAQSTLAGKSQFLVLRPVISTPYCRHLATDAEKRLSSLRTALHITRGESVTAIDRRRRADRFRVFTYRIALAIDRTATRDRSGLEFHPALRLSHLHRADVMIVCKRQGEGEPCSSSTPTRSRR